MLAGLEVLETLISHDVATRHPIAVGFFTDEEGARFAPDMLGSLVYVGGLALEEALDIRAADDGARVGDELERIGYAGPCPVPGGDGAARLRRVAHRAGARARGRGRDDRRGRVGAGHLVDRGDHRGSLGPRGHHARCGRATTPATPPPRSSPVFVGWPVSSAGPRWPPLAGSICGPTWST